jgi:hypothetical protein
MILIQGIHGISEPSQLAEIILAYYKQDHEGSDCSFPAIPLVLCLSNKDLRVADEERRQLISNNNIISLLLSLDKSNPYDQPPPNFRDSDLVDYKEDIDDLVCRQVGREERSQSRKTKRQREDEEEALNIIMNGASCLFGGVGRGGGCRLRSTPLGQIGSWEGSLALPQREAPPPPKKLKETASRKYRDPESGATWIVCGFCMFKAGSYQSFGGHVTKHRDLRDYPQADWGEFEKRGGGEGMIEVVE